MKSQTKEEQDRILKLNKTALYDIGYEHVNNINEETDRVLEEYSDIEVPESLTIWFDNHQARYNKRVKAANFRSRSLLFGKRAAIFLIAMTILAATVTMSVEAYRVKFFNMMIDITEEYSAVNLNEETTTEYLNELPEDWENFYYPTILPEDYQFSSALEANGTKYIIFKNSQMVEIYFVQGVITANFQLDSENVDVVDISVNDQEGLLIIKETSNIISWHDNHQSYYIQGSVDKSVLMNIAESIIKNK
ncbi:MAG: DUF4367 domain-containing protein [Clostridiales bacterium]|nr:DUF4367 domain-containing protein [Clostridiales bacterium]